MSDTALSETQLRVGLVKERRLARMRLGQSVCEILNLLSDPEIRVAIVPLNEAEHEIALTFAARLDVADNFAGNQLRDRVNTLEILAFAIRDPQNLEKRIYSGGKEVADDLDPADVGYLIDNYYEMADSFSPSIEKMSDQDQSDLKKALREMDWNELSGKQWYAAKRFLMSIMPDPLGGSLLGSTSIMKSTTTNE